MPRIRTAEQLLAHLKTARHEARIAGLAGHLITFDGIKQLERAVRKGEFYGASHYYTVTRLAKDTYQIVTVADPERWPNADPEKYVFKFIPEGDRTFAIDIVKNAGWGTIILRTAVGHGDADKADKYFPDTPPAGWKRSARSRERAPADACSVVRLSGALGDGG